MSFILWIMLYGITVTLSETLSAVMKMHHFLTVPVMLAYWFALFRYLYKHNYLEACCICPLQNVGKLNYMVYAPLLLAALFNVFVFVSSCRTTHIRIDLQRLSILSILNWLTEIFIIVSCVVGEELVFRGVLLSVLMKHYTIRSLSAISISSVIFAGMHIFNIFSGGAILYTLAQVLNAWAVGFCLGVVCCLEHSIIPCIVIHSLINISALLIEEPEASVSRTIEFKMFIVLPSVYVLYGCYLYWKGKDRKSV